jgi:uncharacterized membrane protein YhiD involved in acid resistance
MLLAVILYLGRTEAPNPNPVRVPSNANAAAQSPAVGTGNPLLDIIGGGSDAGSNTLEDPSTITAFDIVIRLFFAVLLAGILAFRPRKDVPLFRRSLFVSQTQILLAVVAAALMMIVGDSAARAFAIFAAASLVRFRTNIRDPKEITVLLISLALGLAAGVGRWELGLALCLFALALLWLLEYNEQENIYRSMTVTIKTRSTEQTELILKKIFKRMKLDAEVRELNPPDEEKPIGSIDYYLNIPLYLTTYRLSDRILKADSENIEKISW